ncbi:uncharacterized protein [Linepithema humile]|uniref:uncharacterized protein n=1 Tax=Linepithema humile TaxID=83485 RepID=UPI00351DE183
MVKYVSFIAGSYQEKKLHPVTAVATNKCKITNIDTINTKFIIRGHSCIDDVKASPTEKSKLSTELNISENLTVSDISLSEISKMINDEGSYQEKKLDPVTAVATNKCKITNIDTINTTFFIRGQSCIDDVKDENCFLYTNTDVMSNINDFVKNDIRNTSTDIINDLSISSILDTNILEKEIIDSNLINSNEFPDLLNTDISFNSILNNNAEKQLPSTSCKFQEIKTNNVKNLCFAQENDTEIQGNRTILYVVTSIFMIIFSLRLII